MEKHLTSKARSGAAGDPGGRGAIAKQDARGHVSIKYSQESEPEINVGVPRVYPTGNSERLSEKGVETEEGYEIN